MSVAISVAEFSGAAGRDHGRSAHAAVIWWSLFLVFLATPGGLMIKDYYLSARDHRARPATDFIYFYSAGRMLNRYAPAQLYDYPLQQRVASEIVPDPHRQYHPNPYPPFVAMIFRPLARLDYSTAYLGWMVMSVVLYVCGVSLLTGYFYPADSFSRSAVLCLALCWLPFLRMLALGQIAAVGFLAMSVGVVEDQRGRRFLSGLGLSLCLYKPTLLLIVVPMLLIGRRYKTLAGLVTGGASLVLVAVAIEGFDVWRRYFPLLFSFGAAAASARGYRPLQLYIDLASFHLALGGAAPWLTGVLLVVFAILILLRLAHLWRTTPDIGAPVPGLLWSATLIWTLVINLYVPVYDSLVAVVAVIIAASALHNAEGHLRRAFTIIWVTILSASWGALLFGEAADSRLLTVLFAVLGTLLLIAVPLHRAGANPQVPIHSGEISSDGTSRGFTFGEP